MAQYQSFPGTPGASSSLDKLQKLAIPSLRGRRFLDVGCNEGFFCGYALFDGAAEAVGIDRSEKFIAQARERFPVADFHCQEWDTLPDGPFDVILMASALHYANDQQAMVQLLMAHLAPAGTLVLELGVASGAAREWVKVARGIDERLFPTMPMVAELLAGLAWKHMGPSVSQSGDPVRRHIFHVHHRKPVAYLLLQSPGSGKSTIARELFAPAGVQLVSGDATIAAAVHGNIPASPALVAALSQDFSTVRIDQAIERVVAHGLAAELVELFFEQAASARDFALDAYVPPALREAVEEVAHTRGFLPVVLQWTPPHRPAGPSSRTQAERFFEQLGANTAPEAQAFDANGYVDEAQLTDETLTVRGWAFDEAGRGATSFELQLGAEPCSILERKVEPRSDVQKRYGIPSREVGFILIARRPPGASEQALSGLSVRAGPSTESLTRLHLGRSLRATGSTA